MLPVFEHRKKRDRDDGIVSPNHK